MGRSTRNSQSYSQSQNRSQINYNEHNNIDDDEKTKRIEGAASKLVSYLLHNLDNTKILRQTQIQKHVAVKGVNWNQQLKAANLRLVQLYGCELVPCDDPSVKATSYYVKKLTPHINISDYNVEHKRKKIVTFLLMAIVFMLNDKCKEQQIFQLFTKLNVIDDDNDSESYIKDMLKELSSSKMIVIENECVSWGPMADVLVNKMEILEFVSKVYGTSVESWGELHDSAVEQRTLNQMDEQDVVNADDCEMDEAGPSQKS
ncbi:melanoma-associated antigen B18-like [Atheta coriaria]|uniref:melanoma-associated antigen B18-like n=1 Tax=Dalotia coriaria TaxID=877792 RepID=UPI0031F3866D